jgi:hypothetical protein
MRDAELFLSKLGGLEGGGEEVGKFLVGIVSGKTVVARAEAVANGGTAAAEDAGPGEGEEPAGQPSE